MGGVIAAARDVRVGPLVPKSPERAGEKIGDFLSEVQLGLDSDGKWTSTS